MAVGSNGGAAGRAAAEDEGGVSLLGLLDPVSFGKVLAEAGAGLAQRPLETALVLGRLGADLAAVAAAATARALGADRSGPAPVAGGDRRFADPAWQQNPAFFALQQSYLLSVRALDELVEASGLVGARAEKARFAAQLIADALAPTNFLASNPAALKRAFDTGGASALRGLRNFLQDLRTNGGLPHQVDRRPFTLGQNTAATPGAVVFRNELIELIQYAPQTEETYELPLLLSPPWINKYYVMDLAPGKSFVEWAVQHGHSVFVISYRNPDESLRELSFDDYLLLGPCTAIDVMREITGAPQVNVAGLCLGGTLTGMLLAHLAARGDDSVCSATLLNALLDFTEPGQLGAFTDAETVDGLERQMAEHGYLEKEKMARTFDLLRANDLIYHFVVNNWLLGEDPPAFDLLAWNADGTRMPAKMHTTYLRSCYLENRLARGELELAGTTLDLGAVRNDVYVVGAEEDHIAPWGSCYQATQLLGGTTRFVLTSSGHIAGIVNPPSPKRSYYTNDDAPADPAAWRATAERHSGSWWEDWIAWISERAGAKGAPPTLGSGAHPPLGDAPGTYVLEQ